MNREIVETIATFIRDAESIAPISRIIIALKTKHGLTQTQAEDAIELFAR